jgi:hypothetical protein
MIETIEQLLKQEMDALLPDIEECIEELNDMATKMKKGIVTAIDVIVLACPECGGTCENTQGSTMIDATNEVVRCMECGAECAVPASAFKVKVSKRLPREIEDIEDRMERRRMHWEDRRAVERDYIQEY